MKTPIDHPPEILSLGEVLWDLLPAGPSFGGAAANFACHAAALGAKVAIASAVGLDSNGRDARNILAASGVDTALLQETPSGPTGAVTVTLDATGKPAFSINPSAAWDHLEWSALLAERIATADAVYFGTLGQRGPVSRGTIRRALAAAKDAGVLRVLDVNLRPPFFDDALIRESIGWCSILKLSDDELPTVAAACGIPFACGAEEAALRLLLERFDLRLVALTRGAEGALLVSPDETIRQPGIATEVCDTVGAGDAFTAALVIGLLAGGALSKVARRACEIAAFVCSQPGAVPQPAKGDSVS